MQFRPDGQKGFVTRLFAAAFLMCAVQSPVHAQVQRPPEVIALQVGGEDCTVLGKQLGDGNVWVSQYKVDGGRNTFASSTYSGSGTACFRSIQQCERFLTEMALDYELGQASGTCRKGQ